MKRREFMRAVSAVPLTAGWTTSAQGSTPAVAHLALSAGEWATIEAVQMHLLPSEPDAPGSDDVHATAYLDRALADPGFDPDVKRFILRGVGWLNDLALERAGAAFHHVDPAGREDLLGQIAKSSAGERWLSTLLTYTLEALLADPLYGGNPDGIGWAWLEHDPGRPRPTPDKVYGRLGRDDDCGPRPDRLARVN